MTRQLSEPLAHMTTEQRERYAERIEAMADGANGSLGARLRDAAALARGGNHYDQGFRL